MVELSRMTRNQGDRLVACATIVAAIIACLGAIAAAIVYVVLPIILNNNSTPAPTQTATTAIVVIASTQTDTQTASATFSAQPSATPQPTLTPPTMTKTLPSTYTDTSTPTPTQTDMQTPSATFSLEPSVIPTEMPSNTSQPSTTAQPTSCCHLTETNTPMPTYTYTPTSTSTLINTIIPSPTHTHTATNTRIATAKPTQAPSPAFTRIICRSENLGTVTIPGNTSDGIPFVARQAGTYLFTYESGAYSTLATDEASWRTAILAFSGQVQWVPDGDKFAINKSAALRRIADTGSFDNEQTAVVRAQGRWNSVFLRAGQSLTLVAVDHLYWYSDNPGSVVLHVTYTPSC